MKVTKSSWREYIEAIENASKIIMGGRAEDLENVNWEIANNNVDAMEANRTLHKVRATKIEFNTDKGISFLQRSGKIFKVVRDDNKMYFQIFGYLLYYIEI